MADFAHCCNGGDTAHPGIAYDERDCPLCEARAEVERLTRQLSIIPCAAQQTLVAGVTLSEAVERPGCGNCYSCYARAALAGCDESASPALNDAMRYVRKIAGGE